MAEYVSVHLNPEDYRNAASYLTSIDYPKSADEVLDDWTCQFIFEGLFFAIFHGGLGRAGARRWLLNATTRFGFPEPEREFLLRLLDAVVYWIPPTRPEKKPSAMPVPFVAVHQTDWVPYIFPITPWRFHEFAARRIDFSQPPQDRGARRA